MCPLSNPHSLGIDLTQGEFSHKTHGLYCDFLYNSTTTHLYFLIFYPQLNHSRIYKNTFSHTKYVSRLPTAYYRSQSHPIIQHIIIKMSTWALHFMHIYSPKMIINYTLIIINKSTYIIPKEPLSPHHSQFSTQRQIIHIKYYQRFI